MDEDVTRVTVDHGGDGTTVVGTDKFDYDLRAALRSAGFRWSRNLGSWYLPRTWAEPTRRGRVAQLCTAVGCERVDVIDAGPERSSTAEERAVERVERGEHRAEYLAGRAEKLEQTSEAEYERSREAVAGIPYGQPILVGHHSEKRHRRDLERSQMAMGRSVAASEAADGAREAARAAGANASGHDSLVRASRRLERNEAELRRVIRIIDGTGKAIYGHHEPMPPGTQRDRLIAQRHELEDEIARDRDLTADKVQYTPETVHPGDLVKISGTWCHVLRSNTKTVTVCHPSDAPAPVIKYRRPYAEITEHRPADASARVLRHSHVDATDLVVHPLHHLLGRLTRPAGSPTKENQTYDCT